MPGGPHPQVSIIVPVFNEARRLPASLAAMFPYFSAAGYSHEVLIVVEHSTDGTLELARDATEEQAHFRVIDNRVQRGKGYAVRSGMRHASGDLRFFMDVDLSVPLEEIDAFLACFAAHPEVDILLGNRQHAQSRIEVRQSGIRQSMGKIFNRILRSMALLEMHDTQCGFKAFRRRAADAIFARQTLDGFAFDVELLLLARALGFTVRDLPVRWRNSPESKVHILRDSLRMLRDAALLRRRVARVTRGGENLETP